MKTRSAQREDRPMGIKQAVIKRPAHLTEDEALGLIFEATQGDVLVGLGRSDVYAIEGPIAAVNAAIAAILPGGR